MSYPANQKRIELVKRAIKNLIKRKPNISNKGIQKEIGISHMTYFRNYREYVNDIREQLYS